MNNEAVFLHVIRERLGQLAQSVRRLQPHRFACGIVRVEFVLIGRRTQSFCSFVRVWGARHSLDQAIFGDKSQRLSVFHCWYTMKLE